MDARKFDRLSDDARDAVASVFGALKRRLLAQGLTTQPVCPSLG